MRAVTRLGWVTLLACRYQKCLFYGVFPIMGPSVTIPPDNTWHACGTVPDVSYPLRLFGIQNVEDARLRACVLSYLWHSFVGGVVDRLLLRPTWGCWSGVRGDRIVFRG